MKSYCYVVGAAMVLFAAGGSASSIEATGILSEESYQAAVESGFTAEQIQQIQEMPDFSLENIQEEPAARSAVPFSTSQKNQVVAEAKRHLGKPYAWGGKGPNVFDCSGLTRYVFLQVTGKNIGDYTVPQEKAGEQISVDQAEPGDLYFWGTKGNTYHVAVAIGNGQYIHAPNENEVVKVNSITYFKPSFAVKVIKNNNDNNSKLVSYRTHLQDFGWGSYLQSGQTSGSIGKAKRLEGIQIKLDPSISGSIQYKTHIQSIGWQVWKSNNELSGTTGQAKRLEGIQIKLSGEAATKYDVQYRVHSQSYGWQAWTKNGQSAGTQGLAKRLEAIEIKLVPKNTALPAGGKPAFIKK
ncbi:hypothetical protein BCR21_02700 [Enterococcus ureasiticus]|uniref:NlpC/P60 domain-containing protein n=1 Tax=Enterococcus ureasiticus TaxID=903984 RepID=A0A1E5GMI7_9ENTE|nr:hypothetical protein BCR21_02700 [Enterococcus ureasiticus]